MPKKIEILKQKFTKSVGLPFQELLPESTIIEVLKAEKIQYRDRLFNPIVTLWAFLSQVLDSDKSCSNAVSRIITWLTSEGVQPPSTDTGGYCKARMRLSEKLLQRLLHLTGWGLEAKASGSQLWCGHHVKLLDGSSVSMPDTAQNQKAYVQHTNQAPGCGFPIAKILVMFSLATGAAMGVLIDVFNTSDVTMARKMYSLLNVGDVALADRAFGTYVDLGFVQALGAEAVFRKHQSRNSDFRRGKRLGADDHIVIWYKPQRCPKNLSQQEFDKLPESIKVREVRFSIPKKGFRTKVVIVVTTLLNAKVYTKTQLAQLYRLRWEVEVNLRHVKTTLGMEQLRGKTPSMVRKEIYVHLMAYNLLRTLMWSAGISEGVPPLRLSLQGTRQHLNNFIPELIPAQVRKHQRLYRTLLELIVAEPVPERPGRVEPRTRKRRPKPFPLMKKPRSVLQQQLAA
jgi:hypothetical protein